MSHLCQWDDSDICGLNWSRDVKKASQQRREWGKHCLRQKFGLCSSLEFVCANLVTLDLSIVCPEKEISVAASALELLQPLNEDPGNSQFTTILSNFFCWELAFRTKVISSSLEMSVGLSKCCTFSCGDVWGHRLPFLGRHFLLEILSFLLTLEFCKRGNLHKSLEEQLSYVLLITSVLFNGRHSHGKMIEMNLSELNKYDPNWTQLQLAFVFLSLKPLVVRSVGASMLPRRVFCHSRLRLRSCLSSEEWRSCQVTWGTICRVNISNCAFTIYGRMATSEGLSFRDTRSWPCCQARSLSLPRMSWNLSWRGFKGKWTVWEVPKEKLGKGQSR